MKSDTIVGVATGMTNSGIGIIRVSGQEAIEVVDRLFEMKHGRIGLKEAETHTIHYGFILDEQRNVVDEVMVSVMKAPRSFTTEDTVEINCHGGILIINRVLELVIKNGARLSEPGEFTKRAFLNGRIDLSEAEAVMDIISAKNEIALKNSVAQLRGSVSEIVKKLRNEIIYEIAFIESALDDPEHISMEGYPEQLGIKVDELLKTVDHLILSADNGKMIREGINTVIVGKPNVGKSSLLNLLAGEEKAIVTDIAGTTRDILEETIKLHGIGLNMIDTAGIHTTEDVVEKIGVEKAKKYAKDADLIIYIVDASVEFDENDYEILDLIQDKKCIVLLNKTDLDVLVSEETLKTKIRKETKIIKTSTKENTGIDEFEEAIKSLFLNGDIEFNHEVMITNMRHKQALIDAYESLKQVKMSLDMNMPEDFYSIDLMSAYTSLGFIIGEEVGEDLVNEIFSKFCMGK